MKLYRRTDDAKGAAWAVQRPGDEVRWLLSDPFCEAVEDWRTGEPVPERARFLPPVAPSKIVGVGRNYRDHAAELNNPMPKEPLLFLKAPSSLIADGEAVLLPPESGKVQFEGEVALVVGRRLTRASIEEARDAIFGIAPACDVTARDLQRSDATFARGKSFDTFCPLGPYLTLEVDPEAIEVVARINGEERQRGHVREMAWGLVDLVRYVSQMMTLEAGDLLLTGTPAGVGDLNPGDQVEVELAGIATLRNSVARYGP